MTIPSDGVRFIPGSTDILIVAPHSPIIKGEYQNDLRTGIVAEKIHDILGCTTIINDRYFKPKGKITKDYAKYHADLFRIDHSRKVPFYQDRIREVIEQKGRTLVVWVHGIADDKALEQGQDHSDLGLFEGAPGDLCALIGYGQGGDPKTGETADRLTVRRKTVETIRDRLSHGGVITLDTHPKGSNYRGRDAKRMNQWFVQLGYGFDQVESIQLELREKGLRDSRENAEKTGAIIATALS